MLIGHSLSTPAGVLLAMDPTICEILQRSERELIGMDYADLTHAEDRSRNVALVARLGIFEGPLSLRKRYVRPDGSAVWADVRISRLSTGDDVGRLVGTIQLVDPTRMHRGPESRWRSARQADAAIQRRRAELGDDLFADHAWIILLQVYLAEAEGRMSDVEAIGEYAVIRPVLVVRWLHALEQKGLLERFGGEKSAIQLTAAGIAKVERLLDSMVER